MGYSSPSFVKRGQEGDLTIPIYLKLISPNPSLQKRGFFMMLLLVILLEMYLREIKNGGHLFAIKLPPLFRKEGARGRFYDFNLSKTSFPIISICAFSAFKAGI